jgi:hypothetical protein
MTDTGHWEEGPHSRPNLDPPVLWIIQTDDPPGLLALLVDPETFLDCFLATASGWPYALTTYHDELVESLFGPENDDEEK